MKPKVRVQPITKTRNGTWNGTWDGTWNGMGYGNLEQTHGTRNGNTICSNYTTHGNNCNGSVRIRIVYQNQNQNSLVLKRQNDNTSPGDWPRKISH